MRTLINCKLSDRIRQVLSNESCVQSIAAATRKYRYVLDTDTIDNCVLHGIWKCINWHQPKHSTKFSTSLYSFIRWECSQSCSEKQSSKYSIKEDEAVDENEFITKIQVQDCLNSLPRTYRIILEQYYFYNMNLREIGKANGYSREIARRRLETGKERFKRLWNMSYCPIEKA